MKAILILVSDDYRALGVAATAGDLRIWREKLADAVAVRFGVRVLTVAVAATPSEVLARCYDDADVQAWLTRNLAGDGWMRFLAEDDAPPTVRTGGAPCNT